MPSISSAKARRTAARLAAVQALYQLELGAGSATRTVSDLMQLRQDDIPEILVEPDAGLLATITEGLQTRLADVDQLVNGSLSENRTIERSEAIMRAIYRAGAYELLTDATTPMGIIINDYVNVAHAFFSEGEHAKINAVLNAVAQGLARDCDSAASKASPAGK